MFYSQVILARKGPLGKIWLAAHFDKKLSKHQIFSTDITDTVDTLLSPNAHLALRVSGHLMLGIVRIYSKKVKYLMVDCTEAMWKMNLAFKPGKVDIDPTLLPIDDKHYGNISFEEPEFSSLENIGFGMQSLFVSRLGYFDDDSVFTDMSEKKTGSVKSSQSVISDIEEAREGAPRNSMGSVRTPIGMDTKRNSIHSIRLDDDLPSFEDHFDNVFSQSQTQMQVHTQDQDQDQDPSTAMYQQQEFPMETDIFNEAEEVNQSTPPNVPRQTAKVVPKNKTKVQVDGRIELSEKQFRQRIAEPTVFLRRPIERISKLASSPRIDGSFSSEILHHELCSELAEVYNIASNSIPFPFPFKRARGSTMNAPEEPEHIRGELQSSRSSPEKANLSLLNIPAEHSFIGKDSSRMSDVPMDFDPQIEFQPAELFDHNEQTNVSQNDKIVRSPVLQSSKGDWHQMLSQKLSQKRAVDFKTLSQGLNKSDASKLFLELLQMKANNLVQLKQPKPYGEINVCNVY